jgi:hypothetical protein
VAVLDAQIDHWIREIFWPALFGSLAAFAYLSLLARAQVRARVLASLLRECRRRIERQQRMKESLGFAPRLEYYRTLEIRLRARLLKEGVRI